MGILRKWWSVTSFGIIPYRSGSEKVVRQLRAQAVADRPVAEAQYRSAAALTAIARQVVPQGQWAADPSGQFELRYHDGSAWTGWVLGEVVEPRASGGGSE
jgi:hypothetical protein